MSSPSKPLGSRAMMIFSVSIASARRKPPWAWPSMSRVAGDASNPPSLFWIGESACAANCGVHVGNSPSQNARTAALRLHAMTRLR